MIRILEYRTCVPCHIISTDNRSRRNHIEDNHFQIDEDNCFHCIFCGVSWENMYSFMDHLNAEHSIIKYTCSRCMIIFDTKGEAENHISYDDCKPIRPRRYY